MRGKAGNISMICSHGTRRSDHGGSVQCPSQGSSSRSGPTVVVLTRGRSRGLDVRGGGGDVAPAEGPLQMAVERPDPADRRRLPQNGKRADSRGQGVGVVAEPLGHGGRVDEVDSVVHLAQHHGHAAVPGVEEPYSREAVGRHGDVPVVGGRQLLGRNRWAQPRHESPQSVASRRKLEHGAWASGNARAIKLEGRFWRELCRKAGKPL